MDELMETKMGELSGLTDDEEPKKTYLKKMEDAENDILDPIEKYEIRDYLKAQTFFDPVIGNIGIERYEEVIHRVRKFIEFLKTSEHRKIIVISHSGYYDALLKEMFNINVLPKGDMTGGKNCWICYCIYDDGKFKMISPLNSEHLSII
jgi:broad specificity phosphatase PhoE